MGVKVRPWRYLYVSLREIISRLGASTSVMLIFHEVMSTFIHCDIITSEHPVHTYNEPKIHVGSRLRHNT